MITMLPTKGISPRAVTDTEDKSADTVAINVCVPRTEAVTGEMIMSAVPTIPGTSPIALRVTGDMVAVAEPMKVCAPRDVAEMGGSVIAALPAFVIVPEAEAEMVDRVATEVPAKVWVPRALAETGEMIMLAVPDTSPPPTASGVPAIANVAGSFWLANSVANQSADLFKLSNIT